VFENRVLRRVFGPKRDDVTGEWRKLHNEELSDLYSLPNILRVVKSRRMRWAWRGASSGCGLTATGSARGWGLGVEKRLDARLGVQEVWDISCRSSASPVCSLWP
jgi:hypothetical protein